MILSGPMDCPGASDCPYLKSQKALLAHIEKERAEQAEVMAAMKAELDALKRMVYGRSSEKMPPVAKALRGRGKVKKRDPEKAAARRKENKEKRKELETVEVHHPVAPDGPDCPGCGKPQDAFQPVGEGRRTQLYEYIPASFRREEHIQQVLACPCGEHIVVADGPRRVGDGGGNYGPGFISQVMVSRTADAIPFYRQEKQFKRLGIPIARATMVGLFHRHTEDLSSLADRILEHVRYQKVVLADETPMKMQIKAETGKAGKGYFWTFIGGDGIAYRFSPSRSGQTPSKVLGGTEGTLVVDAYTGYNQVTGPEGRNRAGCLAHVRRKFFDASKDVPEAREALDRILDLYLVEHEAKALDVIRKPAHLEMRKQRSAPLMAKFHKWLIDQQPRHLPRGAMGKAIAYALNNWDALEQFLKSEQIPIDNNASERALRIVALHRKNSLTVGHDEAGENHARILTLVATCEAHDVNPQQYLADVLLRVQTHPDKLIDELLPWNWKPPPADPT